MTIFICEQCYEQPCKLERDAITPPNGCTYPVFVEDGALLSIRCAWVKMDE